jgi:FtsK/SpoIIIE family
MDGDLIKLGRALDQKAAGPLVARNGTGVAMAVWPYGPGFAPHCLIVGSTGGGKTSLLRYMVTDLVRTYKDQPKRLELGLADGKGASSFLMFSFQPGVVQVANKPDPTSPKKDPIPEMVRAFHGTVQARYGDFATAKLDALASRGRVAYDPPPLAVLLLDEYMDWVLGLAPKLRGEMITRLTQIGQIGREVNCRLWLAMQAPYVKAAADAGLPGLLKMQLKARIAATGTTGMDDREGQMGFDDPGFGDRIEVAADAASLAGDDRKGIGMIKVARHEQAFKTGFMADPLHWETSDKDREAAWRLLPHRPTQEQLDSLKDAS